jgi:epoxyqueuosine reductase QueG
MYQFAKEVSSTHQRLIYRSIAMERIAHRRWIRNARQALHKEERESSNKEDAFAAALEALLSA